MKKRVLVSLAEYFCLTTNDLVGLIHGNQSEPNQRSMRRALSILREENLVTRLPYLDLAASRGGRTFAYGLSDRGVKFIKQSFLAPNPPKTFDEHSARTLDHELAISYFHISLKRYAAVGGLELHWRQSDLKRGGVHPDAYFALTNPKESDDRNTHNFFLEIERAKKGFDALLEKLGRYYDLYDTEECGKQWSFKQFRVVLVQSNELRRQNLHAELAGRYNHRMFWLTTQPLTKTDMGGDIFKTPRDPASRIYSFESLYSTPVVRMEIAKAGAY